MKKMSLFKKLFTSLMTSALVMTSVVIPTDAAEDIIKDTPVQLTIHKYEMTGTGSTLGTGSKNDVVPGGATPLNDVEFTVYKIADIEQSTDSNGTSIKYKLLPDIAGQGTLGTYIDGGMSAVDIKAAFIENATVNGILTARTDNKVVKTTANDADMGDGIAKFTNAELDGQGLYLVVETDAPDKVTTKVAPFIVSLPTTLETTTDGSEWLYDVHVFPKNSTQLSSVTINKSSKVPDESSSVAIAGAKFKLEKDIDGTWTPQTVDGNGTELPNGGIIEVPVGGYTLSNLSPGKYRFIETEGPDGHIADKVAAYEFTIGTDGKVSVNNVVGDPVSVVNEKPTVEKEVLKKNGDATSEDDWSDQTDYSVGDIVTFKIDLTVPSTIENLKNYKVTDTFTEGVFKNVGNFAYKFYKGAGATKEEVTNDALSAIAVPTVTTNGSNQTGWTLDLTAAKTVLKANNITAIEITYDATLTEEAITAGEGNKNKVALEFSNNADTITDPDDKSDETTTITDEVVVYTFGIQLIKTFEDGVASASVNATFDLYEKLSSADGSTGTLPGDDSIYVKWIGTYTTDADGKIILDTTKTGDSDKGFSNGTYYFVETDTADGYNLLKNPIEVTVQKYYKKTFTTTTITTKYLANGLVDGTPVEEITGAESTTWYSDGVDGTVTTYAATEVKVVNKKGFAFPTTGGRGTIIFTVAGLVLMGVAVVIFFKARKKNNA